VLQHYLGFRCECCIVLPFLFPLGGGGGGGDGEGRGRGGGWGGGLALTSHACSSCHPAWRVQALRSIKIGVELLPVALTGDGDAHMGAFFAVASTYDEGECAGEAVVACVGKYDRAGHVVGRHGHNQRH
jgi:hypothetical protein